MSKRQSISAAKLWFVLARASASIGTYIERSFGQQGFCLTDFMILEALLHKGALTISAIGEKVQLASASMTSAIDRLEERGLVIRNLSAEDRRVRLVGLTCEGRLFITQLFESTPKTWKPSRPASPRRSGWCYTQPSKRLASQQKLRRHLYPATHQSL